MKISRILVLALAVSAVASAASATTIHHLQPTGYTWVHSYYSDAAMTQLVSVNTRQCDGTDIWEGYNGNPDITLGEYEDYVETAC